MTEQVGPVPASQFPKLVAKLKETFKGPTDGPPAPFGSSAYAQLMLTAVPIEQVAESLNKRYLYEAHKAISQLRLSHGARWDPAAWSLICSPWVFEGWEYIDGVRVHPTCPLPWQILLVQTEPWFGHDISLSDAPLLGSYHPSPHVPLPMPSLNGDSIPFPKETS